VTQVAKSAAGYAFVEANDAAYGAGGWRIWFLPTGVGAPIKVDAGTSPGAGGPPTIALDGDRIAWAGFDEPARGPLSFLKVAAIASLSEVRTVITEPIEDGLLWTPVLDRSTLWYAVIHADFAHTGRGDEFHIESVDLDTPDLKSVRFAGTGNDFEPAISPAWVVWKTTKAGIAALSWGALHIRNRESGSETTIPVDRARSASVGDRFVTFQEISRQRLLLYDTATSELLDLTGSLPKGTKTVSLESVAGNLLVCAVSIDDAPPRIATAILP
jgi:hypothetical protein